jgi:hypothetical protein
MAHISVAFLLPLLSDGGWMLCCLDLRHFSTLLSNIFSLLYLIGRLAEYMEYIPTDEILDALAPEIGIISFHLGIELGLRAVDLEEIQYRYQHDLVKQTKQVLYDWRNNTTVKATLGES